MSDFKNALQDAGLTEIKKIEYSATRGDRTYYSAFTSEGKHLFIKQITNQEDVKSIDKEKTIDKILVKELYEIPELKSFNYIATNYYDNHYTLHDVICNNLYDADVIGSVIVSSFNEYINFVDKLRSSNIFLEEENWITKFRTHIFKVCMSSGWYDNPNLFTVLREIIVGVFAKLVSLLWKFGIKKIPKPNGISHGDLHWKNVMCNDSNVEIIDVENVMFGDSNLDVAFYYVRLYHYFKNDDKLMGYLNEGLNLFKNTDYYDEVVFDWELRLFKFLVKYNRKFR